MAPDFRDIHGGEGMRWGLRAQIMSPVIAVTVLAIGLSAFLNYGKFLRTLTSLEASRFTFAVADLKGTIEGGLDLGVSLAGLATAQKVIDEEAVKERQISAIVVFDEAGKVLFRTGRDLSFSQAPSAWIEAVHGRQADWLAPYKDDMVAGTRLTSDIGQTVGGVAVLYPRNLLAAVSRQAAERLAIGAIVIAAITALATFQVVSWLLGRVRREVGRLVAAAEGGPSAADSLPAEARRVSDEALAGIAAVMTQADAVRAAKVSQP
jgi:hypothetical protein